MCLIGILLAKLFYWLYFDNILIALKSYFGKYEENCHEILPSTRAVFFYPNISPKLIESIL